ncbi:MAG: TetR/AcrR family transcriptional regulator [Thermodesulfobacteriota bacterium]|nr:TetR/AcrR family transcriptional regulator [Thermodesulfobacteriota bacterium]
MYFYDSTTANSKQSTKGKRTRERILNAGKKAFTQQPYSEASVRKMQQAGDFNYALIRYYFGSKKGLFEAVAMELANDCIEHAMPLVAVFSTNQNPVAVLPDFIGSLLDYYFDNPEAPGMIMFNIGASRQSSTHKQSHADLPGITALQQYIYSLLGVFQHAFPLSLSREIATDWAIVFSFLSANGIGAARFHAAKLGLAPDSREYRNWVKEAVLQIFEPVFEAKCKAESEADNTGNNPTDPMISAKNKNNYISPRQIREKQKAPPQTKGEISRNKILEAARQVFTRYPYKTASIRKIGQEGGFDFTLVHHYFPTKRSLAEAVAENFYDDFFKMTTTWISGMSQLNLKHIGLYRGLSSFIDHCVDFYFSSPSSLAMVMQNIGQPEQLDGVPGFKASQKFYKELTDFMTFLLPLEAPKETVQKWHYCLTMLINNFVGAPGYPAQLLNMDPNGPQYRQWVKDALVNIFYPSLRKMIAEK